MNMLQVTVWKKKATFGKEKDGLLVEKATFKKEKDGLPVEDDVKSKILTPRTSENIF